MNLRLVNPEFRNKRSLVFALFFTSFMRVNNVFGSLVCQFLIFALKIRLEYRPKSNFLQAIEQNSLDFFLYPSPLQGRGSQVLPHTGLLPSLMPADAASPAPLIVSSASFMEDCKSCSTILTSC